MPTFFRGAKMETVYDDIDKLIEDIRKKRMIFAEKALKLMGAETEKAVQVAEREFGVYQQKKIKQIFDDAITKFYDDYTPSMYDRNGDKQSRSHGLYDILDMRTQENGMVIYNDDYLGLFDRSKMHMGRDRDTGEVADLFDKVFIEGWHGGAKGISSEKEGVWGKHPPGSEGYYRTGGTITLPDSGKSVWHRWGSWGKKAKQMLPSPYELICKNIDIADIKGGDFDTAYDSTVRKYNDEAMKRVEKELPSLAQDVL